MATDLVTVKDVSNELGWPLSRARTILDEIDPVHVVARVKLYDREKVKDFLTGYLTNELTFLGLGQVSPEESYDENIVAASEASELEV